MALRESPFPNALLAGLHALGWGLIFPCFWFLDRLIAACMSTTLERTQRREQECYLHPLQVLLGSLLFFTLFLLAAPVALLGFLLWAPLQAARRPFSYHRAPAAPDVQQGCGLERGAKATFGFVTANLCLLPDGLARFNNLGHTQRRAALIGKRIVQGVNRPHIRIFVDSPSSCGTLSPSSSLVPPAKGPSYGATEGPPSPSALDRVEEGRVDGDPPGNAVVCLTGEQSEDPSQACPPPGPGINSNHCGEQGVWRQRDGVACEVSPLFPADVALVCLQEVFERRAARVLTDALAPVFGHVLYDVGVYACTCSSFKFLNSGLFLASRYPLLEARYHCFPNGRGEDSLAAKGLLSAKVLLGKNQKQKKVVGYFNCTHLHATAGEGDIRCEQLNMLTTWIDEFQATNKQEDEVVVFDVLCGDFNFDNCSPDDGLEQKHSLFEDYTDPCRSGPGKEKPWVIGTLLEQPTLYDECVRTPENLQRTLEREDLRKQYVSSPVPLEDTPMVYPEPGQPWVGRRIDYVLYRESSVAKRYHTEVDEFTFVTQLAGLTDHIPVGLRLNVSLDSDGAED